MLQNILVICMANGPSRVRPDISKVAVNISSKQLRTADYRWSFSLGVGRGTNNSSPWKKDQPVTKCYTGPRQNGRLLWTWQRTFPASI